MKPMMQVRLAAALALSALLVLPLPAAGVQLRLYSIARDDGLLRAIDPADGSTIGIPVTITLPANTVAGGNGLATHPGTGITYGLVKLEEGFPIHRWLVTIDPSTGNASKVGNTFAKFAGIAFDSGGTLYAVTGDGEMTLVKSALYKLSLADATPTFAMSLGSGGFGETIGFNPDDGFLYHASGVDDGLNPDTRIFEKINLSTLAVTPIPLSGTGYSEMTALVFSGGVFLGADTEIGSEGEVLLSLTTAGAVDLIGSTDHIAKGLAFGPSPPPPRLPSLGDRGVAFLVIALLALGTATLIGRVRGRSGRGRGVV